MENKPDYFHHIEHRKFQNHSKFTLWLSLVITLIFTIVEFAGGIYANSLALLSDSFHMLSDVLALGLSSGVLIKYFDLDYTLVLTGLIFIIGSLIFYLSKPYRSLPQIEKIEYKHIFKNH